MRVDRLHREALNVGITAIHSDRDGCAERAGRIFPCGECVSNEMNESQHDDTHCQEDKISHCCSDADGHYWS